MTARLISAMLVAALILVLALVSVPVTFNSGIGAVGFFIAWGLGVAVIAAAHNPETRG